MIAAARARRRAARSSPRRRRATRSSAPASTATNLAGAALAAFREAAGWDGPPVRLTIDKRVPVAAGMGGGSGDAAAALRLAARAAGRPRTPRCSRELAPRLGADVPAQVDARPRARDRRRARSVERAARRCRARRARAARRRSAARTPDVFREADRLGLPRDAGRASPAARGAEAALAARRCSRRARQRPPARRALAVPGDRRGARGRARRRRRRRAGQRLRARPSSGCSATTPAPRRARGAALPGAAAARPGGRPPHDQSSPRMPARLDERGASCSRRSSSGAGGALDPRARSSVAVAAAGLIVYGSGARSTRRPRDEIFARRRQGAGPVDLPRSSASWPSWRPARSSASSRRARRS